MLTCHAHIDHVGGHAYLKNISGAQFVMMDKEVELLQSGGKTDFNYGSVSEFAFVPVEVDRVVRTVRLSARRCDIEGYSNARTHARVHYLGDHGH
jgi:glyoxylase-like metal-dependent hydrolase (beta-lactamase superfamily II)